MRKGEPREMWALKMSKKEKDMLRELAAREGVNMSAMVRALIRRSYERRVK
jgi:hypothetical protein